MYVGGGTMHGSMYGGGSEGNKMLTQRAVTLARWMDSVDRYSREFGVSRKHIRTEEEHQQISLKNNLTTSPGKGPEEKGWFAEETRKRLVLPERNARMSRQLQEGDVVWGLHNKGVVWLPAVIERVVVRETDFGSTSNANTASTVGTAKSGKKKPTVVERDVSFDLSYFLSQNALHNARAIVMSRDLTGVDSSSKSMERAVVGSVPATSVNDDSSSSASLLLLLNPCSPASPNKGLLKQTSESGPSLSGGSISLSLTPCNQSSEQALCSRVFDYIVKKTANSNGSTSANGTSLDNNGIAIDVLDTTVLLSSLQQDLTLLHTVKTSVALSGVLTLWFTKKDKPTGQVMRDALLHSFPKTISKAEFLEFCSQVLDISMFRSVLSNSNKL